MPFTDMGPFMYIYIITFLFYFCWLCHIEYNKTNKTTTAEKQETAITLLRLRGCLYSFHNCTGLQKLYAGAKRM